MCSQKFWDIKQFLLFKNMYNFTPFEMSINIFYHWVSRIFSGLLVGFKRKPEEPQTDWNVYRWSFSSVRKNQPLFYRPILSLFITNRFLFCTVLLETYDIKIWFIHTKNIICCGLLETNSVLYSEVLTMLDNIFCFREGQLWVNQKCCFELARILIALKLVF